LFVGASTSLCRDFDILAYSFEVNTFKRNCCCGNYLWIVAFWSDVSTPSDGVWQKEVLALAGEYSDDDKTQAVTVLTRGTVIEHYRIIEKIGAGGMGEVYLAEDTKLNRNVALKFLSPHLCQDEACRQRFEREAQAAAKLDHPNIVTVYEVGEFQGRPFFAMQHIEGQSLRELIKGKELPIERVIELAIQICEGLYKAHQSGIVHRDVKPANILIDVEGRAKILDFGLASVASSDHLTKTGSTLGTIGYMSPEQAKGEEVDQRSDIFSLGVVLYEMITSKSPFKTDNDAATLRKITESEAEPLARYKAGVSDELQRIVSKLLQKNPALRYQTAADVIADLMGLKATSQHLTGTPVRKNRTWHLVAGVAALVLLAIAAYGIFNFHIFTGEKASAQRRMLAVLPFENLGSPDDEYFADGMTDEITAKLAAIHDLGVISRTSTMLYKHTTKSLREVAKELGVDYVLEGTLLWDKGRDTSRVRILPKLIRVSDNTHLWAETYQRPLTDIFAMQSDIATRIVEAMNITLLPSENAVVQALPTRSLDAYQSYLRGIGCWIGRPDHTRENGQLAVQMFQRAVELDSTFALAYANLAFVRAGMYWYRYDPNQAHLAQAKVAADRALELQPNLPWAHAALGYYHYWGFRDYGRALEQFTLAETGLPSDPDVLGAKAYIWRRQGKFRAAVEQLERVFLLNPRNAELPMEIADTYRYLREYASAEEFDDMSIDLMPDQYNTYVRKAWNYYLWRGDTGLARATLALCPRQGDDDVLDAWFWQYVFERNYAAALSELESMSPIPEASQVNYVPKVQLRAIVYYFMNYSRHARAYFDSARAILESELALRPDDDRVHSSLGVVYAGLGRKNDAIREGKLGVELCSVSRDALMGPNRVEYLARIYVMVSEYDAALDQIEYLLSIPCDFTIPLLRLDPEYDPLRKLPRYQKLVEKYGT
jgi:eukaryotic-like serine/threonine-protein kinase